MAQTRNVIINFITKLQERGLQRMSKQTYGLNNNFNRLRKSMLRFVGLTAIFSILAKSMRGFIDEGKEMKRLEILLNNLGKGFETVGVEEFLGKLQVLTGVVDDQLRPAFGRLLRELKNVGASQALLNVAIDVSRGTGQDLETIITALTRAFNGNNTQLKRLQIGLSKAALEGKDFSVVLGELEKLYGKAGEQYLDTYAGKMEYLKTRLDEAGEAIGKGILDGLTALGDGNLQKGLDKIVKIAEGIGKAFEASGKAIQYIYDLLVKLGLIDPTEDPGAIRARARQRRQDFLEEKANREELERLAKLSAARAAALERKNKAKKAADEAADALKKRLEAKFDIDNINLAAAAQRNLSETDRARVEALQALKTEGVKDDEASLNKLIELEKKREEEIQRQARESIMASASVKNQRLSDLQAELDALQKLSLARTASIIGVPAPTQSITTGGASGMGGLPMPELPAQFETGVEQFSSAPLSGVSFADLVDVFGGGGAQTIVNQYISGSVTTERELFDKYVDAIFQINRQGTNSQLVNLGR
jgi:hypothetical protein